MTQYINKDALMAEIKKEIKDIYAGREYVGIPSWEEREIDGLEKAIKILNTLEVKEVEEEAVSNDLDYIKKELDEVVRIYKPNGNFGWGTLYNVATHFFELGLKYKK